LAKTVTVETVVRGDIIDNIILRKFANKLKGQRFACDFVTSVAVPPFMVAAEKNYPSLAVMYVMVDLENLFDVKRLLEELASEEKLEIISYKQL
jgi:hypothetical protein